MSATLPQSKRAARAARAPGTAAAADVPLHLALALVVGACVGVVNVGFVASLQAATEVREAQPRLIFGLPAMGLVVGAVLQRWGGALRGGTRAVFDAAEGAGGPLSLRMAPLIFAATVATHLAGGSAGREGAAVLLGACVAEGLARLVRAPTGLRRPFLLAGMAAGFASVFGTPVTATLFALECTGSRRLGTDALLAASAAAVTAQQVASLFGGGRPAKLLDVPSLNSPATLLAWGVFAVVLAATAEAFVLATESARELSQRLLPAMPVRMAVGGGLGVLLYLWVGTDAYLGLGDRTIDAALAGAPMLPQAFALKLVFTALTLGFGFVGGEVTPLFFIGATLGSVLAAALGLPPALGAAMGLTTLFAAAAKMPVALSVMAAELFGLGVWPHALLVAALACALRAGRPGIYDHFVGGRANPVANAVAKVPVTKLAKVSGGVAQVARDGR